MSDRLTSIVGFLAAVVVLGAVVWFIGFQDVLDALSRADTSVILLIFPVIVLWLCAWGMALYFVLRALGTPVGPHKAIFLFTAAHFANNVTPFGQAGGEPISAMFISTVSNSEYENGLAAIASVDTLHFVPSIALSVVGLGFVAFTSIELTQNVLYAMAAVAVLAAVVPIAAYVGWRKRNSVKRFVVAKLTPAIRVLGRVVPIAEPPSRDVVRKRIEGFFTAINRVGTDRRTIVVSMSMSALGWLCLSTSLWLALYALGHVVPYPSILFVVPVGSIAGVTPFPGGLGGIETSFVVLLLPLGVPASVATAAVLIHRGMSYWLPTLFGGGAAAVISAQAKSARR